MPPRSQLVHRLVGWTRRESVRSVEDLWQERQVADGVEKRGGPGQHTVSRRLLSQAVGLDDPPTQVSVTTAGIRFGLPD